MRSLFSRFSFSRSYLPFFLILCLESLAANFAHPVTPTVIQSLGLPDYMFGLAFAGMAFTNFLFSPFWGSVSRRASSRSVLFVCCIGYGVGQLLFFLSKTVPTILFARCFSGFFVGGIGVCSLTYLIHTSPIDKRGGHLAAAATITTISAAFGYMIGGLLGEISIAASFLTQVVTLCSCGVLFFVVCRDDRIETVSAPEPGSHRLFSIPLQELNPFHAFAEAKVFFSPAFALLFLVVLLAFCGTNAFDQCFNYYIKDQFGLTSGYNGMIKAAVGLMSLLANATLTVWILKKSRSSRAMLPILSCCAACMLAITQVELLPVFIGINLIFFGFNAIYAPLLQNLAAAHADRHHKDTNMVMAFFNAMKSMGNIIGALIAGFLYGLSPRIPFFFAAALFLLAALCALLYERRCRED